MHSAVLYKDEYLCLKANKNYSDGSHDWEVYCCSLKKKRYLVDLKVKLAYQLQAKKCFAVTNDTNSRAFYALLCDYRITQFETASVLYQ